MSRAPSPGKPRVGQTIALRPVDQARPQASSPLPQARPLHENLARDAARFHAFVRQNAAGVIEVGADGRFRLVNDAFCKLVGYSESELLQLKAQDITHPDDVATSVESLGRLVHQGRPLTLEKRYLRKDGSPVWVFVSAARVDAGPHGTPAVLAVVLDISERRRAIAAAALSEESYRSLFNSIAAGFCVIEVVFDSDGRPVDYVFLETNSVFESHTGLRNAAGQRMRELAPAHEQYWFDLYGGIALNGESVQIEHEARALNRWYSVNAFPIGDVAPRKVGVLFEDITARRLSEQRRLFLADLAEKLAPLRDDEEIIRVTTEALGRFMQVDRCYFIECHKAENRILVSENFMRPGLPSLAGELSLFDFGGMNWWRSYSAGDFAVDDVTTHPLTREQAPAYLARDVRSYLVQPFKEKDEWTTVLAVADAKPRRWTHDDLKLVDDVVSRVWPLIERARSEKRLVAAHHELEERVAERTAKLQETVSELETFSYSISHDLRAPLRAMQTYASILDAEHGAQFTGETHEYLHRIITAAERMDRLIRDVLVYSRVTQSDMPLERIELASFLSGIIETYPGLSVSAAEIELVAPLGAVRANPAGLTQCVSNLLGNALKFVAPGTKPHVRIWSEKAGRNRRVFFRDNGIGIPAEAHEKIFSMFYQVDQKREGTGVGLAVVRKAAERMGGAIGLSSAPGRGSTFWLELGNADGGAP